MHTHTLAHKRLINFWSTSGVVVQHLSNTEHETNVTGLLPRSAGEKRGLEKQQLRIVRGMLSGTTGHTQVHQTNICDQKKKSRKTHTAPPREAVRLAGGHSRSTGTPC